MDITVSYYTNGAPESRTFTSVSEHYFTADHLLVWSEGNCIFTHPRAAVVSIEECEPKRTEPAPVEAHVIPHAKPRKGKAK